MALNKDDLVKDLRTQQDQIRRQMSELDALVRQNQAEVDKLSQREMSVTSRRRDMEVNFERYEKVDIKNFYTSAQEVLTRVQMMRGQIEQLQTKQQVLRSQNEALLKMIDALEGVEMPVDMPVETVPTVNPQEQIAAIIQAQEKERLRISLQMHDGPAQSMSNLVLRAEICERFLDHDPNQARSEMASLKTAINTVLQDTRRFIFDLRPMTLDDLGLVPTLRRYAQEFGDKNGLEINLMLQGLEARLPSHYEVTIFRFIQEALNNVQRHANASHVRIIIESDDSRIQIAVEDDGGGFAVAETLNDPTGKRNMGIASLKQQAEVLLRGQMGIESTVGRGTRVVAVVPAP
ncbi:MAG TPA: sensor histidine kinase [Herpetosiphonaceae bacterium]|nr:sensor histidine kinase [Herpetosiphonaceae bacterium]